MLIAADSDVNIDSNNGSTPLIQASHFGGSALRLSIVAGASVPSTIPSMMHNAWRSFPFSPVYTVLY